MKNLKINKQMIPYIIAGTITFTGFSICGHIPFIPDYHETTTDLITNIYSNGEINSKPYKGAEVENGVVQRYSKWKKTENGYARDVDYYMPKDYSLLNIMDIVEGNKKFKTSLHTTETAKYISKQQLENDKEIIKATLINQDAKTIKEYESEIENEITTTLAIGTFLALCYGIDINRKRRVRKRK